MVMRVLVNQSCPAFEMRELGSGCDSAPEDTAFDKTMLLGLDLDVVLFIKININLRGASAGDLRFGRCRSHDEKRGVVDRFCRRRG